MAQEGFVAPCRCLVPSGVPGLTAPAGKAEADAAGEPEAEEPVGEAGSAAQEIGEATGASVFISGGADAPSLSDRIVTISGTAEQQEGACRQVLRLLRAAQGAAGDADGALFVVLVPSTAAAAVVGTRGARVQSLSKNSGAAIEVSREVIPGIRAQPVTLTGTLEQVLVGTSGVQEVLQELVERGRLRHGDFPGSQPGSPDRGYAQEKPASGAATPLSQAGPLSPSTVVLVVGMSTAGYVIGKQGQRIADLQRSTGASIRVQGGNLPGMRCGDRLIEVAAENPSVLAEGLRATLQAMADAGDGAADLSEARGAVVALVPASAVGFVIGKGGQNVKEIMSRLGVDISFDQDGPPVGSARAVQIDGGASPEVHAEAVQALMAKVDELRARQAGSLPPSPLGPSPGFAAGPGPAQPASPAPRYPPASPAPRGLTAAAGFAVAGRGSGGYGSGAHHMEASIAAALPGPDRSSAELELLAGIQASGVLDHRLTMRVPTAMLELIDPEDFREKSGASVEVLEMAGPEGEDPDHSFVTLVGQRIATSLGALYLQEEMSRHGHASGSL